MAALNHSNLRLSNRLDSTGPISSRAAYLECLGCSVTRADERRIQDILVHKGWSLCTAPEYAKIVIVLTCGFTEQMEDYNKARIDELISRSAPGSLLFVGGCLPAIAAGRLILPEGSFTFSPARMESFEEEIASLSRDFHSSVELAGVPSRTDHYSGLVRVSTGCMSSCSFCAIPRAAGRTKSRMPWEIVGEVQRLVEQGVSEIKLTSEDFSSYGLDIGLSFVDLLEVVLRDTSVQIIGMDTLNPRWVHPRINKFLDILESDRIDRRLYVPIQSGSDSLLKRMARGYDSRQVKDILSLLGPKSVSVSTDFIVGFPGESAQDFDLTRELANSYSFGFVEVFAYTERIGTPASSFAESIPREVRSQRAKILIADLLRKELDKKAVIDREGLLSFLRSGEMLPLNSNIKTWSV